MQPQRTQIYSPPPAPLERGSGKRPDRKNSSASRIKASDRLFLWCLLAAVPITIGTAAWFGSLGVSRAKPAAEQQKVMKILIYQPTIKPGQQPGPKTTRPARVKAILPPPRAKASTAKQPIKTLLAPPRVTAPQAPTSVKRPEPHHASAPARRAAPAVQPIAAPQNAHSAIGAHPTIPVSPQPKAPSATIITPPIAAPAPRIEQQPVAPPVARTVPAPAPVEHQAPALPPVEHKEPARPVQVEPKAPPPPSRPAVADRETPELLGSFSDISLPNFDPTALNTTEVKVTWTVDSDGRVHGIKFRPTGNSDVDDAIRSAVQNYKFKPRVINGIAQPAKFEHTFDLGG